MTYKIGTRVRHSVSGVTGKVAELDESDPLGMTVGVAIEGAGYGYDSHGHRIAFPSGWICFDYPHRWIPIVDRHEPAEQEFTESLDKLLGEVSREAV